MPPKVQSAPLRLMTSSQDDVIYQLKISLRGIRPTIWRRVQCEGEVSMGDGSVLGVGVGLADGVGELASGELVC